MQRRALTALIELIAQWARSGQRLGHWLDAAALTHEGVHAPAGDALDGQTGFRWFFHCHAGEWGRGREAGHFHLFREPQGGAAVTHLLAITVDAQGLPQGLFCPNRWVTDEQIQPARRVLAWLGGFQLEQPAALAPVHRWLALCLQAFQPQVREVIRQRDARLRRAPPAARPRLLEDRRVPVLSRVPLSLFRRAAELDTLPPSPYTSTRRCS